MADKTCPECGASVPEEESFCNNCGAELSAGGGAGSGDASGGKSSKSKIIIALVVIVVLILLAVLGALFLKPGEKKTTKKAPTKVVKTTAPKVPVKPKPYIPPKPVEPPVPNCVEGVEPVEFDKGDVRDMMDDWANAWTEKDFDKYKSFYSKKFKGVKRTIRQKTTKYNYRSWMRDRKGMVDYADWLKLGVENLEFVCASDSEIQVKFTQSYQSPTYNDVGPKTITLDRKTEELKIIFEEMLASEPL